MIKLYINYAMKMHLRNIALKKNQYILSHYTILFYLIHISYVCYDMIITCILYQMVDVFILNFITLVLSIFIDD